MHTYTSLLIVLQNGTSHQEVLNTFLSTEKNAAAPVDLHFVNQPDTPLQIDDVRQLAQDMMMTPYQSDHSTFVILEIDKASLPAQNALLKSLEEPPQHIQIMLTTSRIEKVLPTIQSRCVIKIFADQSEPANQEDINQIFQQIKKDSFTNLFLLSEKYKERGEAMKFLDQLTRFLHQRNQEQPQLSYTQALKFLITTQDTLEKNVNVRLALEDLFFRLKTLFASSQFI